MKKNNGALHKGKEAKNDEFYTQITDIEKELRYYKKHFKGKIILCNCDDPRVSNFFDYFSRNFKTFGLKKLIATCYKNQDSDLFSQNKGERAVYLEYTGTQNEDNLPSTKDIRVKHLKGDGDFRSAECIELLKEADIVVTNPPFSLYKEYIIQLMEYKKKFLIVGNITMATYVETFPLIQANKMWLGHKSGAMKFTVPENCETTGKAYSIDEEGVKWKSFGNICWYTNLKIKKREETVPLYDEYSPKKYPKYENFDAINVNKVKEIPMNYKGIMGVPITFLGKHNPAQFDIIGLGMSDLGKALGVQDYKPKHRKYRQNQNRGTAHGDLYMMIDGVVTVPFSRVLIRNKTI